MAASRFAPRRTLLWTLGTVALLALLALLAYQRGETVGDEGSHFGYLSLAPALVAIPVAFATRQVVFALFLGVMAGGVIYAFGSAPTWYDITTFPWARLNVLESFVLRQLGTRNYAFILLVYMWSLGGLLGVWARTGGAIRFADWVAARFARGPRSARVMTWLLGVMFFQGANTSTVLAGTAARPVLDRHKVTKEEGTYITDSTASSAATLLPFNVWPIYVAGIVAGTIPFFQDASGAADLGKAVQFFFRAIPFNFYAIFAITGTLLFALGWLPGLGAMRRAIHRGKQTGALVRPGSEPLAPRELHDDHRHPGYPTGLSDFLLPIAFLVTIAVGPFLMQRAFGKDEPTVYIVEAFFAAFFVAILIAVIKGLPLKTALDGALDGAKGVSIAAIILGLAITLKGVGDALGTGTFVAVQFGDLPVWVLPVLLQLAAMVIAFSTGTSFGTFAVLFPVAMPLAHAILPGSETFLALCFGAVVSGSIFGDQASPISDTTILSSLTLGCDLMDHVTTQLPYAALASVLAAVGFVVCGIVLF